MGIRERLEQRDNTSRGIFGIIGGMRLDGKSTLAGTLPGKTLMMQAGEIETGSESAKELAKELNNDLDIVAFTDLNDLKSLLVDPEIGTYDNLYIDSISAITELRAEQEDFKKTAKKNIWDAYRLLGDDLRSFLRAAKGITSKTGQNVFLTMAYKPKYGSSGEIIALEPDIQGQVTLTQIQKLCPIVLAITKKFDENGVLSREIYTKSTDIYPARVDSLLDQTNPGKVPADLTEVLKLIKGEQA